MKPLEEILGLDKLDTDDFEINLWLSQNACIQLIQEPGDEYPNFYLYLERDIAALTLSPDIRFVSVESENGSREDYQEEVDGFFKYVEESFNNRGNSFRRTCTRAVKRTVRTNIREFGKIIRDADIFRPFRNIPGAIVVEAFASLLSMNETRQAYQDYIHLYVNRSLGWLILKDTTEQFAQDLLVHASYLESNNRPDLAKYAKGVSSFYHNLSVQASIAMPHAERFGHSVVELGKRYSIQDERPNIGMLKDRIMAKVNSSTIQVPGHLFGVQAPNYQSP